MQRNWETLNLDKPWTMINPTWRPVIMSEAKVMSYSMREVAGQDVRFERIYIYANSNWSCSTDPSYTCSRSFSSIVDPTPEIKAKLKRYYFS